MDLLANLSLGFGVALSPVNVLVALAGCVVGTAVGVLPGLGPTATVSLLLPLVAYLDGTSAVILMAGIYYGAMYGGSITSILVKIPGEAASVVTCLDGYQMARKGRAGAALGLSALASFAAGIAATIGVAAVGPAIAAAALKFGPVEKTSLVALGLVLVMGIGQGSRPKALLMIGAGLLLSTVGIDLVSGEERFVFDVPALRDGFGVAIVAMGLFGLSEVIKMLAEPPERYAPISHGDRLSDLLPNRTELRAGVWPAIRGSGLGFGLGLLPGGGAMIASFASYMVEKRLAKDPAAMGQGAVAGVTGPEAANNAGAQASFIPLLCLGIPANAVIGVIMGAILMAGVVPGPNLIVERPEMFWGVIASMFLGNIMLVALNIPLVGAFVALLRVPRGPMAVLIVAFCVVGAYSFNASLFDVAAMIGFGVLGYWLQRAGFDTTPLLLAFVLGALFEQSLRQGLIIGYGEPAVFLESPISAAFLAVAAALTVGPPVVRACLAVGRRA